MESPNPARRPTEPLAFTIIVEVDLPLTQLTPHRREDLSNSVRRDNAHVNESPLGNALVYFDSPTPTG
ncbi:hypothetical protein CH289_18025 [Rhodococcus sp. RS1C4]|nr:hypothetical protein CH289_18025 [Rhodococcus sp. RS1C4]